MLTFDEAAHRYFWCGEPVPNVTGILKPLTDYSHIPAEALENARLEGVAVHKMVELDCKGDLDTDTLPGWMEGHWQAWQKFKRESGFECHSSEQRLYHTAVRYAGTCDLVGKTPRMKNVRGLSLIDIKRSFYAGRAIGVQLMAYATAWEAEGRPPIHNRFALRLDKSGDYRLMPFTDREDWSVFLACLTLHRYKERNP